MSWSRERKENIREVIEKNKIKGEKCGEFVIIEGNKNFKKKCCF